MEKDSQVTRHNGSFDDLNKSSPSFIKHYKHIVVIHALNKTSRGQDGDDGRQYRISLNCQPA